MLQNIEFLDRQILSNELEWVNSWGIKCVEKHILRISNFINIEKRENILKTKAELES